MKRVILESPYSTSNGHTIEENLRYARNCMRDCILRSETPYASHLLLTQENVLDDNNPEERTLGINAGFCWRETADKTVVYTDMGISSGMKLGIEHAKSINHPIEYRSLKNSVLKGSI